MAGYGPPAGLKNGDLRRGSLIRLVSGVRAWIIEKRLRAVVEMMRAMEAAMMTK